MTFDNLISLVSESTREIEIRGGPTYKPDPSDYSRFNKETPITIISIIDAK